MTIQSIDLWVLAPTLVVAGAALVAMLIHLMVGRWWAPLAVGLVGLAVAAGFAVAASGEQTMCADAVGSCSYVVAPISLALQIVVLAGTFVVLLMAAPDLQDDRVPAGEFVFLLMSSAAGAVLVPAVNDLVTLIVALEVVSLPTFALVALNSADPRAAEAALKAFLFSVASVAVSLYGVALLYGATGSVTLPSLAESTVAADPTPIAIAGLVMLLAVFAFKVAAVPFHAWAPDTYEGASVPVAAYLSVVSKAAGFSAFVLIAVTFASWSEVWAPVVAVIAAVTVVIGNIVALRQRNAVRLLAWSSIAQAGYILLPLGAVVGAVAVGPNVVDAVVAYLVAYAVINLGAFGVAAIAYRAGKRSLDDYRGMAWESPWLSVALAFFLAALAGLPPGVIGLAVKVRVLLVPVDAETWWLAAAFTIGTVVGLVYYLTWAAKLFQRAPSASSVDAAGRLRARSWLGSAAVVITGIAAVALSVAPSLALGLVERL
jgi:NADH-quinone oxidoreductase subunit N